MSKNVDALNKKLLAAACSAEKAKDIRDLIRKGADVHCQNEWGMTPVMLAAQNNPSVVVLHALIAAGADIKATEPKYRSNSLHLAAGNSSNPKIIETLIKNGADLNSVNYLGETPLIMAVNSNKETRVVSALIKAGADFNAKDYQGHSVLEYAKANKRTYIVNTLKKLGAE
ncbi:MAG: ankyrin repeat domain-containing protein [Spirochaetia bacterium]|jgi:ankyrin repeat protein|nr:ankyrin repeat domain-containing protein [Spirochaetia bacterium]